VRELHGLADLEPLIGKELGVSGWHIVQQDRIQGFADVTGDHQWIHVDPERAATGPFGRPVAHGYLTLSMIPFFAKEVYRVLGLKMIVNYGLNKVRFPSPVPAGSRVRSRLTLVSVTPAAQGSQVVIRHEIELEHGIRPACVAETVSLMVG
jgi:acyl dehydratase